jgi:ribosomal protein S18 acetylase RimI-like enzyme
MTISIHPLDAPVLNRHLEELLVIDDKTIGERWHKVHFQMEMPGKWFYSRVALDERGVAVGFAVASQKPQGIHIHRIAVSESQRGRGIGRRLLGAVAGVAHERGITAMTLKVARQNTQAIRFYDQLGFVESARDRTNIVLSIPVVSLMIPASDRFVS